MNAKERYDLIKRNVKEIVTEEELKELLDKKEKPSVYCGYEPSGKIHLGHFVTLMKLLDFQQAGFKVKVLLADWHAWLNKKGDWKVIKKQVEEWKRSFKLLGLDKAEFVIGSEFQTTREYIEDVLKLSLKTTIKRALRSMQQIARDIDNATVSQVIYPFMQVVDIKFLEVDVALGGIEQRKIHMLAREMLEGIGYKPIVCVHTPLISSLRSKGKMSSSDKDSMISIFDNEDEIVRKIKRAFCPEGIIENNPIIEIAKYVLFPKFGEIIIEREEKYGGSVTYKKYEDLERDFIDKKLHPMDLKTAVAKYLVTLIKSIK